MTLQAFTVAYIEAALWSSEPEDDEWLVDELDGDTLLQMEADCASFWAAHEALITEAGTAEGAGHDLWLTRSGHGAGFWDGDWPEPAATTLTQAATKLGNVDLYRGDDGAIHA